MKGGPIRRGRRAPLPRPPSPVAASLVVAAALGCAGDSTTDIAVSSVEVVPSSALLVGVGDTVRFRAVAADSARRRVGARRVEWTVADPAVARVDAEGLVSAIRAGATVVEARVDGVVSSAPVEVFVPVPESEWASGTPVYGRRQYVEYVPGTLPLVISAPHGGRLEPEEIAPRTYGAQVTDINTMEMARAVREAFVERTGQAPHLVVSHLRRTRLDPNRDLEEAAQGDPFAVQAWREYHDFIASARSSVLDAYPSGLYLDLHGHGHPVARVELGYLLSSDDLERTDAVLDGPVHAEKSSIRALWHRAGIPFSALVRGPSSLGGLLEARGYRAVPSPGDSDPGGEPYFSGGYSTARHGSQEDGVGVSAIQLELPYPGVRASATERRAFAEALVEALEAFMATHYGFFAGAPVSRP